MSLQIDKLQKDGDASQEYLLFKATKDLNLNDYAVVDRTYDAEGKISNVFRHFFRFPELQIKKGEFVSLRTGKGDYKLAKLEGGQPVHRFYWGSDAPIWNDTNVESAELLNVATVSKKTTGHPTPKKEPKLKLRPDNLKFGGK
jgi:hypothetical protein